MDTSFSNGQQLKMYGCSSIEQYELTTKLGEGTFGQVFKGVFKPTSSAVALKEIIVHEHQDGIPITALREIKIMKALRHPNILHLLDMAVSKKVDRTQLSTYYMVMSYMDHDLCGLLHNRDIRFTLPHIKLYMSQLLSGMAYLHEKQYMHRDIKSANVLVSNDGSLKIADFGLARKYFEAPPDLVSATPAARMYTPKVVTRWYRPPELLLGEQYYTTAIDMWGIGCIFAEFFKRQVVLPGNSDADQVHRIFKLVGSPNDSNFPTFAQLSGSRVFMPVPEQPNSIDEVFSNVPEDARELLTGFLYLNPLKRLTAKGAMKCRFFTEGVPAAKFGDLPVFPTSRELDVRRKREAPPSPPNTRNKKRNLPRAFAPKLPDKRALSAFEQIPPYKRMEKRNDKRRLTGSDARGSARKQRSSEASSSGEVVMSNGLDY